MGVSWGRPTAAWNPISVSGIAGIGSTGALMAKRTVFPARTMSMQALDAKRSIRNQNISFPKVRSTRFSKFCNTLQLFGRTVFLQAHWSQRLSLLLLTVPISQRSLPPKDLQQFTLLGWGRAAGSSSQFVTLIRILKIRKSLKVHVRRLLGMKFLGFVP